ncbi:MAG: hypothetical protein LBB10_01040 [Bifidobacteriaceae bacterium]|jgi:hypothetical protein|nr:hypothetical protein [Bifidobacteriaceae bacterium]
MRLADKGYYVRFLNPLYNMLKKAYTLCCRNRYKTFWVLFAIVQIYLYFTNEPINYNEPPPSGDLSLYHYWIDRGTQFGVWPILHEPSVYPPYAFIPMLFAGIFSYQNLFLFKIIWYFLMMFLWGFGLKLLWEQVDKSSKSKISNSFTDIFHLGYGSCYYALFYMLAMGGVFSSRIDCMAAVLGLYGFIALKNSEKATSAFFTAAAWTKVFVGANFTPLFFATKKKVKNVILPACIVSAPILLLMFACQNHFYPLSFLQGQSSRNLQIESVAATPSMVSELFTGAHNIIYNNTIYTNEIISPVCDFIAQILNYILVLATAIILFLVFRARKADETQLILSGGLAVILGLIVFNKVGSPQYFTALLPTLAYALSTEYKKQWKITCILGFFVALFTQMIFPGVYKYIINYDPYHYLGILCLAIRNCLVIALFIVVIYNLYKLGSKVPKDSKVSK